MTNSSGAGCGDTLVGIEAIAEAIGNKSISTAQTYAKFYGLPAVKGPGAVWEMDVDKFEQWAKDLGWSPKMHESELRDLIHRKNLREAGPGDEIRGSISYLEKRLSRNMTTLLSMMRDNKACPIRKLENGQYQVFQNQWDLFLMETTPARRSKWGTESL